MRDPDGWRLETRHEAAADDPYRIASKDACGNASVLSVRSQSAQL